jgi:hypothetical protein
VQKGNKTMGEKMSEIIVKITSNHIGFEVREQDVQNMLTSRGHFDNNYWHIKVKELPNEIQLRNRIFVAINSGFLRHFNSEKLEDEKEICDRIMSLIKPQSIHCSCKEKFTPGQSILVDGWTSNGEPIHAKCHKPIISPYVFKFNFKSTEKIEELKYDKERYEWTDFGIVMDKINEIIRVINQR